MTRKITLPLIVLFIAALTLLSACNGLGEDAALSTTQTAMSLQASQAAIEIQTTQTAMSLESTRVQQDRQATEAAVPTDTQIPTDTQPPPTETPTAIPEKTNTPEAEATTTEEATKPPAQLLPTHTPTIVQGQERIRVENNSGEQFKISLECVGGPCQGKNPSSYNFSYPAGLWYFYVWSGRYQIKWTICGETEQFVHPLNGQWYINLKKCP